MPATQLNQEQADAVQMTLRAYQNGHKEYFLSGAGGTGKTFTTGELVRQLHRTGARIAFCASTNAAVQRAKFVAERDHWDVLVRFWGTVHRVLGLRYDPEQDIVIDTYRGQPEAFDVIIVDEASMLNQNIVALLRSKAKFILFVGDANQLLPVGEDTSTAFSSPGSTLEKVVRQDSNDKLLAAILSARQAVKKEKDLDLGSLTDSLMTDLELWQAQLTGADNQIALCFTNDEADRLNRIVRTNLRRDDEYCPGDRIIFTANYYKKNPFTNRQTLVFATNEVATVQTATRCKVYGFPCWSLRVKGFEKEDYILVYDTKDQAWIDYLVETVVDKKKIPHVAKIKYAYALTTHRSQGNEWDEVFVQMRDYSRCQDEDTYNRLVYVALSRARKSVSILVWKQRKKQ